MNLDSIQNRAAAIGGLGAVVCLFGALRHTEQFFQSYLYGFVFWAGIAIGSTSLMMIYHLTGGNWGFVIRRLCESGMRTFPLIAVLIVPVILGAKTLYLWADPAKVKGDPVLEFKAGYLNIEWFVIRAVIYFSIWLLFSFLLNKWSEEQDHTADPAPALRMRRLSGPGIIVMGLTASIAAVDWVMSLEPHWFSTIYGLWFIVGNLLAAISIMVILLNWLSNEEPFAKVLTENHFHDLGNLMFAFNLLWTYISFSQFLIIWSGNLPEEIPWYIQRLGPGWQVIAVTLLTFHFAVPFLILLQRRVKRKGPRLAKVAMWMVAMRCLDLFWVLMPSWGGHGGENHGIDFASLWLNFAAWAGIGGIWLAFFIWQLKTRPLLPLNNPQGEVGF